MDVRRIGILRAALRCALCLLVCITSACGGGNSDRVQRVSAIVWAGSPANNPPLLDHDNWRSLSTGDAITTDDDGQAHLQLADCAGSLYVFRDTAIQVATCLKAEQESGLATCLQQGTGYFNVECTARFIVDTPAGRVIVQGTAFIVTYLPAWRLMLVIGLQGNLRVQPVIDIGTGELGPGQPLKGGYFYYTTPGRRSDQVAGLPPREAIPLEELPPLVAMLGIQRWMDDAAQRAREEDVLPPNWPPTLAPGSAGAVTVLLGSGGGALRDERVQRAVLAALPKEEVLATAFRDEPAVWVATLGDGEVMALGVPLDRKQATTLLQEAGYPEGFPLRLYYPADDEPLAVMAETISANLAEIGLRVQVAQAAATQIASLVQRGIAAGQSLLWLERR